MSNKLQQQLSVMFDLQSKTNTTVNPNWFNQGWDWKAAIIAEVGELFDKLGYKWWKKQVVDIPGAQMELIDILHFTISLGLQNEVLARNLYCIQPEFIVDDTNKCTREIHLFTEELLWTDIGNMFTHLYQAASYLGLSSDDVFNMYIGKNALNNLRQAYGYKEGTYIKDWDGKEDNEVLNEVLKVSDDADPKELYDVVYASMECRYLTIIGNL